MKRSKRKAEGIGWPYDAYPTTWAVDFSAGEAGNPLAVIGSQRSSSVDGSLPRINPLPPNRSLALG